MPSKIPAHWLIMRGIVTNEKHMSIIVMRCVVQAEAVMIDNASEIGEMGLINYC